MTFIAPLTTTEAGPEVAATLKAVKTQIGTVPNLYATLAKAPAALNGLLRINEVLAAGTLNASEREIVALAVSQANTCHYCLSAHTLLGKNTGLTIEDTLKARSAGGNTARAAAIAAFAVAVVENRGHVALHDLKQYEAVGLSERDLLEIIANVAATTLTNYANNVAGTELDFPAVAVEVAA
ncbi:MAG: peroxidase-related enzyme [Gammaproteobacteria bacterium]